MPFAAGVAARPPPDDPRSSSGGVVGQARYRSPVAPPTALRARSPRGACGRWPGRRAGPMPARRHRRGALARRRRRDRGDRRPGAPPRTARGPGPAASRSRPRGHHRSRRWRGRILERCDRDLAVRRRDDGPGALQHDDLAPIHRGVAGSSHPGVIVRGQVTIGGRIAPAACPQPRELPGVRGEHGRPADHRPTSRPSSRASEGPPRRAGSEPGPARLPR